MKRIGLVLGLLLVLGMALAPQSVWAWRSHQNVVVITPGPFCCFTPFVGRPFFHHGFPHRVFIVPSVVSPFVVVPPVASPFVVVTPAPVWAPGFWAWNGVAWVWVPGHWRR